MDKIVKRLNDPTTTLLSRVGLDFIKEHCIKEIDNTPCRKGISFNMFMNDLDIYKQKPVYAKIIDYTKNHYKIENLEIKHYKWIYTLYLGNVAIFKPIIAVSIYKKYNPISILDPCAGWGGRMLGANALNIKYTGIDTNTNLIEPYNQMISKLNSSLITMLWNDCLSVDYSKIDYDMVFTSPPYYNYELYNDMPKRSNNEWNKWYKLFAIKTFKYLKIGGHYAICMNGKMYDIFKSVLGECNEKIELVKQKRPNVKNVIKTIEYIYVWIKV